jgi:quinol monooxygenase YgiN
MTAQAIFITHRTRPGQRDGAVAVWNRIMKPAIQANPHHLTYVYTLPDDEPDVIRAFQLYRTAEDAAAFLRTPEYAEYSEAVEPHLEGPPVVAASPAAWVKE